MPVKRYAGLFLLSMALAFSSQACTGTLSTTTPSPAITVEAGLTSTSPVVEPTTLQPTRVATTPVVGGSAVPISTGQVSVLEINNFTDESGYWYFYGVAHNGTGRTINDLQIEIRMLDSADNEVYAYTTNSMLSFIAPGEVTPFSDFTTEPIPEGKSIEATVVGFNTTDSINRVGLNFRGITLWADDYNDVYLAGEVTNPSPDPVAINSIAGMLNDTNGILVTAATAYPFLSYLEPGSAGPFVMMFDAPLGQAGSLTNYTLFSDAVSTNPIMTYDITLSDNPMRYQDANGDTHLVGSVTNNTMQAMNIYLVAGIYDGNGNVVDANAVYLPIPLNPGATFPYDFSLWGPLDYVPDAMNSAAEIRLFIDWTSTFEYPSHTYKLSTRDDVNAYDGITSRFSGTVVNDSGQDLTTVLVSVSMVDKISGALLATNLNFVPEPLPKDATGSYEVYVFPPNDIDPANVMIEIIALGQ